LKFGIVDTISSLALIAFRSWFAIILMARSAEARRHGHSYSQDFPHLHGSEQELDHETALED
jgi:hypothetical protein